MSDVVGNPKDMFLLATWLIRYVTITANAEQIDAAKELVKKLQFSYSPESFENPVLQKHWRNIEALALDRDAPEEMTDYTCKLGLFTSWEGEWGGGGNMSRIMR